MTNQKRGESGFTHATAPTEDTWHALVGLLNSLATCRDFTGREAGTAEVPVSSAAADHLRSGKWPTTRHVSRSDWLPYLRVAGGGWLGRCVGGCVRCGPSDLVIQRLMFSQISALGLAARLQLGSARRWLGRSGSLISRDLTAEIKRNFI